MEIAEEIIIIIVFFFSLIRMEGGRGGRGGKGVDGKLPIDCEDDK